MELIFFWDYNFCNDTAGELELYDLDDLAIYTFSLDYIYIELNNCFLGMSHDFSDD